MTKNAFNNVKWVEGMLQVLNIYSNPIQPKCSKCDLPIESFGSIEREKLHCIKCRSQTSITYFHRLNCLIIKSDNQKASCTLKGDILGKLLSNLITLKYEDYLKDKSTTIYMLREFFVHEKFILNHENAILDAKTDLEE